MGYIMAKEGVRKTRVGWSMVHGKKTWGWTWLKAGFRVATPIKTKGGLLAFQLLPRDMPPAMQLADSMDWVKGD
jgi:hypothetical protein